MFDPGQTFDLWHADFGRSSDTICLMSLILVSITLYDAHWRTLAMLVSEGVLD